MAPNLLASKDLANAANKAAAEKRRKRRRKLKAVAAVMVVLLVLPLLRPSPLLSKIRNNGEFAMRVVLEGILEWCQGAVRMKKVTFWALVAWF